MSSHPPTAIASTDALRVDFAPYVPVLDPQGRPVFQATLGDGQSVICRDDGVVSPAGLRAASHPVAGKRLAFYVDLGHRLGLCVDGAVDDTGLDFGPAGPTINNSGGIAGRARDGDHELVVLATARGVEVVARGGSYEGLPVVLDDGSVVVHERGRGLVRGGELVVPGADLGRFFGANNRGQVAVATPRGIEVDGRVVVDEGFVACRAAALDDAGRVVHVSTPRGGQPGAYAGSSRLVGLGDDLLGSTVVDLAFNQASFSRVGDLAVRVKLADGRGFILHFHT
jgi:hypothetical protein